MEQPQQLRYCTTGTSSHKKCCMTSSAIHIDPLTPLSPCSSVAKGGDGGGGGGRSDSDSEDRSEDDEAHEGKPSLHIPIPYISDMTIAIHNRWGA